MIVTLQAKRAIMADSVEQLLTFHHDTRSQVDAKRDPKLYTRGKPSERTNDEDSLATRVNVTIKDPLLSCQLSNYHNSSLISKPKRKQNHSTVQNRQRHHDCPYLKEQLAPLFQLPSQNQETNLPHNHPRNLDFHNKVGWKSVLRKTEKFDKRVFRSYKWVDYNQIAAKCPNPLTCGYYAGFHSINQCINLSADST
ncbi:hypothetical protein CROQUDRAFT_111254 [Cronartium quercuum f. sp. fusiforme G11]|uniref:Uncharacterized protein n=1 Tax=Cronartium quercuum f. sp. fusiforme G11 TaxID=708437 RepID=A0A9P6NAF3_9BASI|nr:hypothetical protein CROQUDRAFT_111254 [Cronartium quercuum f. sp. fusiforme G11]